MVVSTARERGRCWLLRVVAGERRLVVVVEAVGTRARDGEHRRRRLLLLRDLLWALLEEEVVGRRRRMAEARIDLYSGQYTHPSHT